MRMMLKVVIPVEAGNKANKDGSLARAMQGAAERLKPEAAYFLPDDGKRTALFFFNMQDGIVKLRLAAVFDAQHGGFATGCSPVSWGSIDELFVNLTMPTGVLGRAVLGW